MMKIIASNILMLVIVSILSSCNNAEKKPVTETEKTTSDSSTAQEDKVSLTDQQLANAGIQTAKIDQQNISGVLRVSGEIDVPPQNLVFVSNPMGGFLKSTKLLPGMRVRRGQVLAVMEDTQYIQLQQDYLISRSELTLNKSEYKRQKELNQDKAVSDKVFEQSRARFESESVRQKSLAEKLRLIGLNPAKVAIGNITRSINVYSPINGFVSAVNVNPGKYVTPADVMFELIDPDDIHLALTIFEKDLNKLTVGQKVIAYNNSDSAQKYTCTIVLISRTLGKERSAAVHCHFDKEDKNLVPGMFMNADIEIKSNKVQALPADAIVRYENKQYAFVARGKNEFQAIEIQTGTSENGFIEVLNMDRFVDELFVVKGTYNLLMKMKNTSEEE